MSDIDIIIAYVGHMGAVELLLTMLYLSNRDNNEEDNEQ